jgi:NAD(P)-dependent dehydrogenase (short-subunit alcohol dehydrogenase family)
MKPCVLITGTTSGLGAALLSYYADRGFRVVAVDRRRELERQKKFPTVRFVVIDISKPSEVDAVLADLQSEGFAPDVFFLNAGINSIDNLAFLSLPRFEQVLQVNLLGTLTFVGAIQKLGWRGKKVVAISSTSTIVPNAKSLGYYISKLSLEHLFPLFTRLDAENDYRTVLLGPMESRLNRDLEPLTGLQSKVFAALTETSDQVAVRCAKFVDSRSRRLKPPLKTRAFYFLLKWVVFFWPTFYYKPYPARA